MSDLITRTNLQNFMGLPVTASAQLDIIITQCSARMEEFCGRTFAQAAYTEFIDGNDSIEICVRNRPLTATGLNVYEDNQGFWGSPAGSFDSTLTKLVYGTDYALRIDQPDGVTSRSGILYRINNAWYRPKAYRGGQITPAFEGAGSGNIKVTYTGGYATIPSDIQEACMMLCSAVKNRANLGEALLAENKENYQYQLRPLIASAFGALPPDTLAILARYRNLGWG